MSRRGAIEDKVELEELQLVPPSAQAKVQLLAVLQLLVVAVQLSGSSGANIGTKNVDGLLMLVASSVTS